MGINLPPPDHRSYEPRASEVRRQSMPKGRHKPNAPKRGVVAAIAAAVRGKRAR